MSCTVFMRVSYLVHVYCNHGYCCFHRYKKRHIALKIAYLGWDYNGFAIQDTPGDTIESKIFEVLEVAKLVKDIKKAKYFKCGRTDKGVSALGQVISLQVRSYVLEGKGVITPEECRAHERKGVTGEELPYVEIFNRILPPDIRVLSWAPVDEDFNARFSCRYRVYKYFFPLGGMDEKILEVSSKKFVGVHDFRNFCKLDRAGEVTNFVREILNFSISPVNLEEPESPHRMYQATITGTAFLWHQVRCMVAILFLAGLGLENPEIIDHMLDVEKCPRKPQYGMASEIPLILFDSGYDGISWVRNEVAEQHTLQHIQDRWSKHAAQMSMLSAIMFSLTPTPTMADNSEQRRIVSMAHAPLKSLMTERVGGAYKPLLSRPSADPVEERLARKKKSTPKADETHEH